MQCGCFGHNKETCSNLVSLQKQKGVKKFEMQIDSTVVNGGVVKKNGGKGV
jgi:hypothetical protein